MGEREIQEERKKRIRRELKRETGREQKRKLVFRAGCEGEGEREERESVELTLLASASSITSPGAKMVAAGNCLLGAMLPVIGKASKGRREGRDSQNRQVGAKKLNGRNGLRASSKESCKGQ